VYGMVARMHNKERIISEIMRAHDVSRATIIEDIEKARKRIRREAKRRAKDADRTVAELDASLRVAVAEAHDQKKPAAVATVSKVLMDLHGLKGSDKVDLNVSGGLSHVVDGEGLRDMKDFLSGPSES